MKIQVLGSGCKKCRELHERTQKAVQIMKLNTPVEYITDIQRIVAMGVMSSPVLAIDDKPIIAGVLPDIKKIEELLKGVIQK